MAPDKQIGTSNKAAAEIVKYTRRYPAGCLCYPYRKSLSGRDAFLPAGRAVAIRRPIVRWRRKLVISARLRGQFRGVDGGAKSTQPFICLQIS